jgi:dihydropyrimidinase
VPNGIPGVGARLAILFSEGVMKGRMSAEQFVAVTATNHARTYGLYPRKGTIAVGSDADIAIWDPSVELTLSHDHLQDGADYTPYEGLEIRGWPVLTMVRGAVVARDGMVSGSKGHGTYLPRDRSPYAAKVLSPERNGASGA